MLFHSFHRYNEQYELILSMINVFIQHELDVVPADVKPEEALIRLICEFNMPSANSDAGLRQLHSLLAPKEVQWVRERLFDLMRDIEVRFDPWVIKRLQKRTRVYYTTVAGFDKDFYWQLEVRYPFMYLLPLLQLTWRLRTIAEQHTSNTANAAVSAYLNSAARKTAD